MSAAKNLATSAYQDACFSVQDQHLDTYAARRFAERVAAILLRMQAGIYVDPTLGTTRSIGEAVEKAYQAATGRAAPPALLAEILYDGDSLAVGGVVLGRNVPALSYKPTRLFKLNPTESWQNDLVQALARLQHKTGVAQPAPSPIFPLP
jgi:hypothetical protein